MNFILNIVKCSRNFEFQKRTDQNFVTQNLHHGKECCVSKKKKLLKYCQKEVIYENILVFAGWWWVMVDVFWLVVSVGGW